MQLASPGLTQPAAGKSETTRVAGTRQWERVNSTVDDCQPPDEVESVAGRAAS